MNGTGRGRPRPLGSMRHSLTIMDNVPKFPPLPQERVSDKLDKHYRGISGNALTLPPTRLNSDPEKETKLQFVQKLPGSPRRSSLPSSKSDTTSVKSEDVLEKRELKSAIVREKQLKQNVMSLQKVIDELKVQVQNKDKTISDLQEQFERQEQNYKELYEKEQQLHGETRVNLENTQKDLQTKLEHIEQLRIKHEEAIKEIRSQLEQQLIDLREEKEKQIADRDEKIKKLKQHMADALKGNSWERQQQIDELTKELTRTQEEVENLRIKVKTLRNAGTSSPKYQNGDSQTTSLQQAQSQLREKDKTIQELKTLCARFEKQLKQQDALLSKWKDSKVNAMK